MVIQTETLLLKTAEHTIEVAVDTPDQPILGWALCLHPHPLFEGANSNKVVTTMARTCAQRGMLVFRPNFRGVGQSSGEYAKAHGETFDMLALLPLLVQRYPQINGLPWVLCGFSFGTAVAAQLYMECQERHLSLPRQLILAGPALWRFLYREVRLPDDTRIIHGEMDDVVPLSEALDWLKDKQLPITVVPDSGHFFHGKLVLLKKWLEQNLLTL